MLRSLRLITVFVLLVCSLSPVGAFAAQAALESSHPVNRMLGEKLSYDISFLWFDHLAEGTISLSPGPETGQYTALLEAHTLGIAALLTRNRVERIETIMEIGPDGLLRPLVKNKHSTKGAGESKKERIRVSKFNYADRTVLHEKWSTGKKPQKKSYPLGQKENVYDILSAFYNLRAGLFGPVAYGPGLILPTFTLRGIEEIIVTRVAEDEPNRHSFFPDGTILCEVSVDPDAFGTKGREMFVGFDAQMVPRRAVVENVIGLGDVRGLLRNADH